MSPLALVLLGCALACVGCQSAAVPRPPTPAASAAAPERLRAPQVRSTGTIQAVKVLNVFTPQIRGQGGRLTLVTLVANGAEVKAGNVVAEFDRTQQVENAREAQAKFDDLGHQAEQRHAQNRADAEKRAQELARAEADLAKALLQLRKGPLLGEIDRLKAEAREQDARGRVESLAKSNRYHDVADAAALRILELQRDRQKVALERALNNAERLVVRAPLGGMVALENQWRNGSMGHAQEGDQLWPGQPLLKIFDPTEMEVHTYVGEPDGAALVEGARAIIRLDAYPELTFQARFHSASPVATASIGSPIKSFAARFRLEQKDPHLLPDLSAAVTILPPEKRSAGEADPVPPPKRFTVEARR